jgi:serine/threonine protein kinase
MAEIVGGGAPVNDWERAVIARLRDEGPVDWLVLHNIEVPGRDETFEVDVIVATSHAVYVIDVKGTRGRIEVAGARWCPQGRQPFLSPLGKLRSHARVIKGLLTQQRPELQGVYVMPLVVLAAPEAKVIGLDEGDSRCVTAVTDLIRKLSDASAVPPRFSADIRASRRAVIETLTGAVRRPSGPLRIGTWEVVEELGGDEEVTEYRARNFAAPAGARTVRLRVYQADPYLPRAQREQERLRIGNAYEALSRMPPHPAIVPIRHLTPIDDESRFVLELEDVPGHALFLHLTMPELALSTDAKLRVLRDVLRALAHAHAHKVVHRALSPATVLVASDGRALLTGFDYARTAGPRDHTVGDRLTGAADTAYLAPECHAGPHQYGPASDVYAAGVIGYQLLTGELPFASATDQHDRRSVLRAEELEAAGVTGDLIALLQRMCAFDPAARPAAQEALRNLTRALGSPLRPPGPLPEAGGGDATNPDFYRELSEGYQLTRKYTVRRRLGRPGTFGVAYQVYDVLTRTDRALKLVLKDRESALERLQHEYQILLTLPGHPNVVRVRDADFLPTADIPFLVLEYVEGRPVSQLLDSETLLGPADVLQLGIDVARGLVHLHGHGVYHCDIKPSNLLWTDRGGVIIDFNVAVAADSTLSHGGGSARYLPPDLSTRAAPSADDLADRDVYALGLTLYEALTSSYPWDGAVPPPGVPARDPRELTGFRDLSPQLAAVFCRAIAPRRSERFRSAGELLQALEQVSEVWAPRREPVPAGPPIPETARNTNPFVDYLQTLFSQSEASNRGTRGRDPADRDLYVATALDQSLANDILSGQFRLVVISGNAGDGKTAFLEHITQQAAKHGAALGEPGEAGPEFTYAGRAYYTNHDGSQDEGDRANDTVLSEFFAGFTGTDASRWPSAETRLIAINEGRLVDYLTAHGSRFPLLSEIIRGGLSGHEPREGIAVVNLNDRSVVADPDGLQGSIFDRVLARMTHESSWEACRSCDLATVCYAPHNAQTFAHPSAGPRITRRLRHLFTLAHLRGRMHITLRDLRSALAYMLTSGRDCRQIHSLYAEGDTAKILDSFYFTSWSGGHGVRDRLLGELHELDVAQVPSPRIDRHLAYHGPHDGKATMTLDDQRGDHDLRLLRRQFEQLPHGTASSEAYQRYLAAARRRFFFECQDEDTWWRLLPYRSARDFLGLLDHPEFAQTWRDRLVDAINHGEGAPAALAGNALALQVRRVQAGTIRSYRMFSPERFTLAVAAAPSSPYLEASPDHLILAYAGEDGARAELPIRLDLFELLHRLGGGYLPGAHDLQGLYLSLAIFKNTLASVPYQEVLVTVTGQDLRRIRREHQGRLVMEPAGSQAGTDSSLAGEQP